MEPISVSFEVREPATGRQPVQQAQGGELYHFLLGLRHQAKPLSGLAAFTFHGNSAGDVLQGHLSPREDFLF
jgi:hypothetical protein